eukprot:gene16094-biopygen13121
MGDIECQRETPPPRRASSLGKAQGRRHRVAQGPAGCQAAPTSTALRPVVGCESDKDAALASLPIPDERDPRTECGIAAPAGGSAWRWLPAGTYHDSHGECKQDANAQCTPECPVRLRSRVFTPRFPRSCLIFACVHGDSEMRKRLYTGTRITGVAYRNAFRSGNNDVG